MRKWIFVLVGGLVVVSLSACDDIKRSMKNMDEVNDESKHLSKRTDDLERELVNKEANTTESDFLDNLYGEGKFSNNQVSEATMLQEAGFAVEAMHFQYWKGDYNEPMAVLDYFMKQALELMFTHSASHIPSDLNPDILQPDRNFKAVAALATQLDRLRPEYAANLARAGLSELSAYDVILEALKNQDSGVRSERLPKAAAMVLLWKQQAIYMLQLRQIYLPVLVVALTTEFQGQKDIGLKFWDTRLWDSFQPGALTIDLATQDPTRKIVPEQLKVYTTWLNQALQTRQALRDLGIQPQSNSTLSRILRNVRFALPPQMEKVNEFVNTYKAAITN